MFSIGVLSSYSIKADYVNNAYRPKQSNSKGRNYAKDNDIKHT